MRTRRHRRTERLGLLAILAVGVTLTLLVGSTGAAATSACATQVNNTPGKLIPCVKQADLWSYMKHFQAIADANKVGGHPSRNSGEPGYLASVKYVKAQMLAAGYGVRVQSYPIPYFRFTGTPTMSEQSPTAKSFTLGKDWAAGTSSGSTTAAVQEAPSGIWGCAASDFTNFVPGRIALVFRGYCYVGVKVLNAKAAGASGVIVINPPGVGTLTTGALLNPAGNRIPTPTIPLAFMTSEAGTALDNEYVSSPTAPVVSISVHSVTSTRTDYNVIADSKGGNSKHVLVVDAHLDAIDGAGMLDNASGSATLLDIARMMKRVNPTNKIRFIWFGGEEMGLLGSAYYIHSLSPTALSHIRYDLDADVMATPNYVIAVLDPTGDTFPANVFAPSGVARDQAIAYLNSIGKKHELWTPDGTDAYNFNLAGIPASGLATGQDCCKSQNEVNLFGGKLGNYEGNVGTSDGGCVDQAFHWCDNLSNNNPAVLTFMSRAFATMVGRMAFNQTVMASTHNTVHPRTQPMPRKSNRDLLVR
jgi:Zn-dependent M28 family amino/carboxypeptidase